MKYLLDTHAFLWMISAPERLSGKVRSIIEDANNDLFLSAVSGWEIAIKARLGKLGMTASVNIILEQMIKNNISDLPIDMSHSMKLFDIPEIHKDPFDRMLIAQAIVESFPIITHDSKISQYDIETVW